MTHTTTTSSTRTGGHVLELDVLTGRSSLTVRLCEDDQGRIGLLVVDHLLGRPVLAQVLAQ
ncbi:MAG: hypothetical protein ACKVWR_19485 [Acidimicrobiales bacterium]